MVNFNNVGGRHFRTLVVIAKAEMCLVSILGLVCPDVVNKLLNMLG